MNEGAVKATFSAFAVQVSSKAKDLELFKGCVFDSKPRYQ